MFQSWARASKTLPALFSLFPWVTSDDLFFAAGLSLSVGAVYILCNGFFAFCDECLILQKYRMKREPYQMPPRTLIFKTLAKEATVHLVTGPVIMLLVAGPFIRHINYTSAVSPGALPTMGRAWFEFFATYWINETLFYFGHRMLHSKAFYKRIHKQHHSYIGTRSFGAEYANFIEDALTGYFPFLCGLIIFRSHFETAFVWFACRLAMAIEGHSGYCFKGTWAHTLGLCSGVEVAMHDHHHTSNKGNFGNELLDFLFGTMDHWLSAGGFHGYVKPEHPGFSPSELKPTGAGKFGVQRCTKEKTKLS
jgi:sterol desaturase/sphingolipid hydroxylase (fatty acid hydroxylase superfamily)